MLCWYFKEILPAQPHPLVFTGLTPSCAGRWRDLLRYSTRSPGRGARLLKVTVFEIRDNVINELSSMRLKSLCAFAFHPATPFLVVLVPVLLSPDAVACIGAVAMAAL